MSDYIVPSVAEIKTAAACNKPKFEAVSLFAGGGGSSTGYRMAGGKILAINEFIPEAINTYQANWPDTIILPGDVRKLTPEHILAQIEKIRDSLTCWTAHRLALRFQLLEREKRAGEKQRNIRIVSKRT